MKDWLATLKWDGTPRIEQWLTKTFGCALDAYHKAVGSKFLVAAVRRVRKPGCKFDYMLILEGDQGIGKSSAIAALFGADWTSDDLGASLTSKDAAIGLRGKWAVEFAEIEHLIRSEVETVKAFLSRGTDHYRPPYEKVSCDVPRQCVLVGTTNSEEYLRDSTGNRRIWPVKCLSVGSVDLTWLTDNREQLWAEAAQMETQGASSWLDDDRVRDLAVQAQSERMIEDAWSAKVLTYVKGKESVTVSDIMDHGLFIQTKDHGKREQMRVAAILRTNGWRKGLARVAAPDGGSNAEAGKNGRWVQPADETDPALVSAVARFHRLRWYHGLGGKQGGNGSTH